MSRPGLEDAGAFIVLGASGGIGASLSRRLASRGASLVLASRSPEPLTALANEIGGVAYPLDATDFEAVDRLADDALQRVGRVAGLVNCAGSLMLKPAHSTRADEWADVIATNLTSAFATVRAGGRVMARSGGSIVLVSSAAAAHGLPNHDAIGAAKGGVSGLTLSAAATYAPRGIRVNAVAPGLVQTPMTQRLTASAASREASLSMHALGRLGEPADVASAIEWLLEPSNSWVTGQIIGVDGGLATLQPRMSHG